MSTNAKPGIGAYFQRWDTVGTTGEWRTLGEVTNIAYSGASREVIRTFKLNNADDYVNKLQGIIDGGNVSLTMSFTRAEYVELKRDLETRGNRFYQIVFPDGEGLDFEGFVTEIPLDLGSTDVMQGDVVIEIDGKPDFVTAAQTGTPA